MENLISLDNHISSMEEEIMVNPKYIKSMGNAGSSLHGRAVAVGKSQCVNFMIFPSIRFYVKPILRVLEVQNLPF